MYIHTSKALRNGTKRKSHKVSSHIRHVNGKRVKVKAHTRHAHSVKKTQEVDNDSWTAKSS